MSTSLTASIVAASAALMPVGQDDAPRPTPSAPLWRRPDAVARPAIDGALDEPLWAQATRLDDLRQLEPDVGAPGSEATEILLAYDATTLYVGIRCHDREPHLIRATQSKRDAVLDPDDRVEFWFDPYHDRRNAYWFQIGPAGGRGDALITRNGSDFNKQWDAIWHGHSRVTETGWEAECEIPLQSISFDPATDRFGFNVVRRLRRRNESIVWASPDPRRSFFAMSNGGTLTGIHDLEQSLGLDVVPFAVARHSRQRAAERSFTTGDVGFDLFWRLTPNVKLAASVNTDFAETEVDERRVNLTRFPLFFPEKRDFFLEEAGNFTFGANSRFGGSPEVLPFFSRRIGIDGAGAPVPLDAALKLTGRTDSFSFGLLDVQAGDRHELDAQNLFAGRFSKNLFAESDAGVIVTQGDPLGEGRAGTYGADFNFRREDFLGDQSLRFSSWLLATEQVGEGGEGLAGHAALALPNDEYDLGANVTVLEEEFAPKLGFVRRTDVKRYEGRLFWQPRGGGLVRQWTFGARPLLYTDLGNRTETSQLDFTLLGAEFQEGDSAQLTASSSYEHLDAPFEIVDGVVIPADGHRFARLGGKLESSEGRPLQLELGGSSGGFWDGRSYDLNASVAVRPNRWWNAALDWERTDANLAGGSFVARVTRLRVAVQFTQDVVWSNFVQHDNLSDTVSVNSRLWWIVAPGREAFLVVNHGWSREPGSLLPLDTEVAVKLGWTLRF
ncbi:MAG: carbohydrate binding family 9 domain-containing protein [Planctomycetes bacterium]|nr:carbohydrate binding family 9 domain-containing protein [Planctomycetota bacterium]